MNANKRSKNSRQRGSHTHGWGAKKKHRGAGHRGGRGKSGTGKKAHQRMPSVWKNHPFGHKGFVSPTTKCVCAINIEKINKNIDHWLTAHQATKEGNLIVINLAQLKYHKLIGKGVVKHPYKITVAAASEKAIEKIKNKGGDVIIQ